MPKPKTPSFVKGQSVSFDLDGNTLTGTIKKVLADSAEVEADGTVYECEFNELTVVEEDDEPKPKAKKPPVDEDEEPEPKAKSKSKGKGKSYAAAFNSAEKADKASVGIPKGTWESLVIGGECSTNEKGTSAFIEFVGVGDEEVEGKTQRKYYQLFDGDGEQLEGCSYFKRDLADLGLDDDDMEVEGDTLEDIVEGINKGPLKKLVKHQPWVSIKIADSRDGKYMNVFIQGMMEDQDNKPDAPK